VSITIKQNIMNTNGFYYDIALKYARNHLNFKGKVLSKMGDGTYAEVYSDGNVAIKVTSDKHDAILSKQMCGLDSKYIVKTHNVFIVDDEYDGEDIYLIINELLEPISHCFYSGKVKPIASRRDDDLDDFEKIGDVLKDKLYDFIGEDNGLANDLHTYDEYDDEKRICFMMDNFYDKKAGDIEDCELFNFEERISNVRGIVRDVIEYGFKNCDLHRGNVGLDSNGVLKMLDIGHRSSDGFIPMLDEFKIN
jgi:hypothetical protein